ncbi:unnamed protein product [Mytilus edulis]|uniref:Novel STAND NTPase 3 domain-containing protein n=1 Tax=Mytilus edulis TaxID=6550 RepID=A0A8S3T2B3_MYTED|nr:unnamed protein product [Mytilus edulis]
MEREERNNFYRFITCSTEISTESVGCVFIEYLTRRGKTLEDFINNNFHTLYHLCYQRRCCQCSNVHLPIRRGILHESQLDILLDSYSAKSLCHKSRPGLPKFCCSKARSGVTVKSLDLTLLNCLIVNCCSGLFWESCFNGGTFENFLNQNKHDIYHHWKNNTPCCQCFTGYIYPCDREMISLSNWNFLFSAKGNPCSSHNIIPSSSLCCCVSATPGITIFQIDQEVEIVLLRHLSFLKKCLEQLVEFRNKYLHIHNCCIPNSDFNQNWLKMKTAIYDCICYGIEDKTKAEILRKNQTEKIEKILTLEFDDVGMRRNKNKEKLKNEMSLQTNTFVETKGAKEAKKILETHNIVFLTGHAGSGKSRIALELLRYFHEMRQTFPIKLTNFEEFSSLVSTDFKCCVLLEDIFGRTNYVFNDNTDASILNDIKVCTRGGNVKVIITIRSFILSSCGQILQSNGLWFPMFTVDLSTKFMLNKVERKAILTSYQCMSEGLSGENIFLDKRDKEEIVEFDTIQGFPESCRLFFTNENYSSLGVNFFKHPTESLLKEIETLRTCRKYRSEYVHIDNKSICKIRYITMVYCLLNDDKLETYKVDMDKVNAIMKSVYGESETFISTHDVIDAANELISLYLLYNDDTYTFQHRIISESVLISYSGCDMLGVMKSFSASFIAEMVKPETYLKKPGEVVLKIPVKYYKNLINLFINLMLQKTDFVFIQCTLAKSEMVKDLQFLEMFKAEMLDNSLEISSRTACYDFLGFVVLNLSKYGSTQVIELLWDFLISECSTNASLMSSMVAVFDQLDIGRYMNTLYFMFKHSNMQFKKKWLCLAIRRARESFFLSNYMNKLCSLETTEIDFNEVECFNILLSIACRTNKIELVTRLFRRILTEKNFETIFNNGDKDESNIPNGCKLFNVEQVLCEAGSNEDDDIELPQYLMEVLPSNDYLLQNVFDAALRSENINIMKYLISNDLSLTLDLKNALDFSFQIGSICLAKMLMGSRRFEPIDFESAVYYACLYDKIDIIDWFGKTMLKDIENFDKDYGTPLLKILGWSYNLCKTDFEVLLKTACDIGVQGLKLLQLAPLQKHINVKSLSIVSTYENSLLKSQFMTICKRQNIDFQYIFSSSIENGNVCCMLKELLNTRPYENILNESFSTQMLKTAVRNGNYYLIKAIVEVIDESKYLNVLPECLQLAVEHGRFYTCVVDFFLTTIKHEKLNCSKAYKTACELGRDDIIALFHKKVRIVDLDCTVSNKILKY